MTSFQRPRRGLTDVLRGSLGAIVRYIRAMASLAGQEGKEAVEFYLRATILILVAVVAIVFGYLLLLIFLAVLLAHLLGVHWLWVIMLAMSLAHIAVALLCVKVAKKYFSQPVFEVTRRELSKDMETLQNIEP